jgi:hypothetical protein
MLSRTAAAVGREKRIGPDIGPDTLLRRAELARALSDAGFPTSAATLATKATRGGGPPYRLYGRIPLYRWGDALPWAQSRLSEPRGSTSDRGRDAQKEHAAL